MVYAMFALTLLTVAVGLIAVRVRTASVKSGEMDVGYFRLMQGDGVPELVTKTTRCFNNLFEVPVLFYVVCTLHVLLEVTNILGILVAWLFVLSRCALAYVHITYNNVKHRMLTFGMSVICVLLLWVNLLFFMM